jgi:hypothetical protein
MLRATASFSCASATVPCLPDTVKPDRRHGGTVEQLSRGNASFSSCSAVSFCGQFQFLQAGSAKPDNQLTHCVYAQQPHKETSASWACGSLCI